jgi:hypothetical protein
VGLHDLERSHYDCVWNLANEIATPRQVGARNDTPFCHCEERDFSLTLRNRLRNLEHEIVKEGIPSRLKIEEVNQD